MAIETIIKTLHYRLREQVKKKPQMGLQRHLAVDSLGFPFFTHCTKANVTDDKGLIKMLTKNIDYFRLKPEELEKVYPEITTTIQLKLSAKPSKAQKQAMGKTGFVPVKTRWVIER